MPIVNEIADPATLCPCQRIDATAYLRERWGLS